MALSQSNLTGMELKYYVVVAESSAQTLKLLI